MNITTGRRLWGHMTNKIKALQTSIPANDVEMSGVRALEAENLRLHARIAELEQLASHDSLTPLFNRRHFMGELDRWCARALRSGGQYGLLFIDVDNMKAVNDGYGHGAGDAMLNAIGQRLLSLVRKGDVPARIGGDEFGILLDNIKPEALPRKAASLAEMVSKKPVDFGDIALVPSISAGFTVIDAGTKPIELMARADRSMYAAKRAKAAYRSDR